MNASVDTFGRTESAICQERIDTLLQAHPEISGAIVSTVDGFDVAAALRGNLSAAKLSAMTSTLLALGGAVTSESDVGECRDIVIEASSGRVLLMDIPHVTRKLLLMVLCGRGVTLGQVLWAARTCREELSRHLDMK